MDYEFNYIGKYAGSMDFVLDGITAITALTLKATDRGYLYPSLHDIVVDFGNTQIYHEKKAKQWWYRQGFNLMKIVLQNAINVFGTNMLNLNLAEWGRQMFEDQIHRFSLEIP